MSGCDYIKEVAATLSTNKNESGSKLEGNKYSVKLTGYCPKLDVSPVLNE